MTKFLIPLLLAATSVLAHAQSPSLTVESAWARASVQGQTGTGAFMTLTAREPLALVGVATPVAGVAEVHDKAGRIDVLVNNAGIGGGGPIEDVPVDWVKTLFETNYFGVVRVIQAVLPGMRERRSGAIVNISSVAGRLAIAGHGHYSAVKHALEALSEALAQEVQRFGIRVAIVEPGVVVTPIFSKARRFADPASPYFDHVRRLLLLYQKQMPHAAQPADAARVIYEAATSLEPRLRWLVGEDARLLVAGRQRMSDEEYVARGRAMPDDQYLEEIRQRFGFTW